MTVLTHTRIAFIGSGVMGEAMIKALLNRELVMREQIVASDPHIERCEELRQRYSVRVTTDNVMAVHGADVVVLSVKPQVMPRVMSELARANDGIQQSLIVSIAAGVKLQTLIEGLQNPHVVRAMPNTPSQIGMGMTVWTAAPSVTEPQIAQARTLLGAFGDEMYVEDERFLDMATALNGTGPAYVFMFMESLIDVGVHMGLSRRDAERLVLQTMRGAVEYATQSKLHPAELRNQVTSPGGTSAEAIYHLEKGGLRTVIADGVWAAYRRSLELGEANSKKGN